MLYLILLIVVIALVLAYVPGIPAPVHTLLIIVAIILGVVCVIVALQMVGVLPALWDAPARIR